MLARLKSAFSASSITWVFHDTERHYDTILELMEQTSGALNFHDALIVIACRDREVPYIVSFDADFDQVPWLTRLSLPAQLKEI